jgi:hypothetical protein
MGKFEDHVKQETSRLVVMFQRPEPKQERFQWGMVGKLPILSLIGCITRAQVEMPLIEPQDVRYHCPEKAFVVAWDEADGVYRWFVHPDIPVDSLIGMLEIIKMALIGTQQARQVQNQQVPILGPDGQPIRRGK